MVAIMDQIPRRLIPRKRFAHLLGRPCRRRMRGDRHVPCAAPIMGEEHQHEHQAESVTVGTTKKSAATIWPA